MLYQEPFASPWRLPFDGSFQLSDAVTAIPDDQAGSLSEDSMEAATDAMARLQRRLYAERKNSFLFIFQAMDAAGKDGTIRKVFSGLDPSSVQVSAFKAPTDIERRHDMLWRTSLCMPARGIIGIFNRSYYEEVLTVKVHPEFLNGQYPGGPPPLETLWQQRYEAIRAHEAHLAAAGTVIVKFWLNVSQAEQHRRFLARLNTSKRQWKFNPTDVKESMLREAYDQAFVEMVNETSRPCAPWYMIPADDKEQMRALVAKIALETIKASNPHYPEVREKDKAMFEEYRDILGG